jgi:hypothetical protein
MFDTRLGKQLASREADMAQPIRPPMADYPTPAAVLADGRLSRSERLRVLDAWTRDIVDREIAARESGKSESPAARIADEILLRAVCEAVTEVEATPTVPSNLLARAWRILHGGDPD